MTERMIIRSSNRLFFLARAEEARADAEQATLDHVRDRCRRSEAAWTALAEKAERSERLRTEEAERKAAANVPVVEAEHADPLLEE